MENDSVKKDDGTSLQWDDALQQYNNIPRRLEEETWWSTKRKCECGVSSLGYSTGHSDYCPLYEEVK